MKTIYSQIWQYLFVESNISSCYTIYTATIFTTKWGITMENFIRKFTQLNGRTATITLEHCWFDKQRFEAQEVNVFEDEECLGLILKGQAAFIYKDRLQSVEMRDGFVEFSDDKLKILIKF